MTFTAKDEDKERTEDKDMEIKTKVKKNLLSITLSSQW